jgi:hypothetical protein
VDGKQPSKRSASHSKGRASNSSTKTAAGQVSDYGSARGRRNNPFWQNEAILRTAARAHFTRLTLYGVVFQFLIGGGHGLPPGRLLPFLLTDMVEGLAYGRSRSGFIPVLLSSFFADTNTRKGRPRNR